MKNAKKLTRSEKKFLEDEGFDSKYYLVTKRASEYYEFYNTETKQTFEIRR